MAQKRILVTGGAGFLGSHLVDKLLSEGHHVVCLDDLSSGSLANIAHIEHTGQFDFVRHDVCLPLSVEVDEVYNFASPASPTAYGRSPIQTAKTGVLGALNMLAMAKDQAAKILQASTSEVYGNPTVHPQDESYWGNVNPVGPRSCYVEAKRFAETLFFDHRREYGLQLKIARIFNVYGPRTRDHDGRVISNFIVQALTGQDLTIYGDGQQTRSFCYVDDLIEGLVHFMASPYEITGPLNIGNPEEITVRALAETIIALTGSRSAITTVPSVEEEPTRRRPSIAQAERVLAWRPKVGLQEGLARTIAYFDTRLGDRDLWTETSNNSFTSGTM